MMSKKLVKILTKSHKFSALEGEWKVEGSSELVVSPASLIMHIFDSQKPVSTNMILCQTICGAQGTMSYKTKLLITKVHSVC